MKHIIWVLLFILMVSCKNDEDKILPQIQNLTESVYSSAIIQPDSLYQVYSVVSGILEANLVEEGQEVEKEDPIIQITNSTPKLNTQNAKLALDLARDNYNGSAAILKGVQDEIEAASLKYKNDSINFYRQKNLWEQNIGSKIEYDTKELNYRLSKNNLQLLRSRYERTKNELSTAIKQAENSYKASLINTTDFTIKSKINGVVYALYKSKGELITTMEPIAAVGSSNNFIIEMLIDEVDIIKIELDQKVVVSLDAYKDDIFLAKVSKILPKKDLRNQTFTIEAVFIDTPNKLYSGLSGEANIIVSEKEKVLTIPKAYLTSSNQVQTEDGLVTVKTGLENLEFVEILEGIDSETYIYKPKSD
ncbi:efflux RND transporter periplasmic adaptor subunit [Pontimicrobium aquaticum]|uniref:HlyD family efflux transporter periplasmic adaptor subunit n=1 Tax=Pontimicrobium aquaticum TaxID=2565367 RepID=A0A4U0F0J6_9FLAO|nr:HlyD family efflux transporter periplasmic adaptor subunit [Pontimicrobium aquaticum]TJY37876.1 HlyD family efflux transporter periplasmic adaptor subunit [Pontimicrobium aquaticum]